MGTAKTDQTGRMLVAQVILLVLSCSGSFGFIKFHYCGYIYGSAYLYKHNIVLW